MKAEDPGLLSEPSSSQRCLTPVTKADTPLTCGPCLVLTPERGMHVVCACVTWPSPLTWVLCSPQTLAWGMVPGSFKGLFTVLKLL